MIINGIARLGKDCEVRQTGNGTTVCTFTMASDYGYGEHKGTNWLKGVIMGKRAEGNLPQYLKKGTKVYISGDLQIKTYQDKQGENRTSVEVMIDKLELVGGRSDSQNNAAPQQAAQDDPFDF